MEWAAREGEGRHKACPYGRFEGGMEWAARKGEGQAQGLPLQEVTAGGGS